MGFTKFHTKMLVLLIPFVLMYIVGLIITDTFAHFVPGWLAFIIALPSMLLTWRLWFPKPLVKFLKWLDK